MKKIRFVRLLIEVSLVFYVDVNININFEFDDNLVVPDLSIVQTRI